MIEIGKASTAYTSDLASYASSYSMAENNFSRSGSSSIHLKAQNNDDDRPKRVRLPSISSIASSLTQPLSFRTSTDNLETSSSPIFPAISNNQRANSNIEISTLPMNADIFSKNFKNHPSSSKHVNTTIETPTSVHDGQQISSHQSSPMNSHQHVSYYESARPPSLLQPAFAPQFQQIATARSTSLQQQQQQQQQQQPHHQIQPIHSPFPQGGYLITQQPQHSYYYSNPIEHISHYTTTTQDHLFQQPQQQHYSISKPKKNYNRRSSKLQHETKIKPQLFCQRCGITETPEWRKGPNGARTLCNACGLFHAKILKREGPEAAANAINANKAIKKTTLRRRSSVNEVGLLHHINHYPTDPGANSLPQGYVTTIPPQQAPPNQQVQVLPPPLQHHYEHQHQQPTVIFPSGNQAFTIYQPGTGFSPAPMQQQQPQQPQHNHHHQQPLQHGTVILSPISPTHHRYTENANHRR